MCSNPNTVQTPVWHKRLTVLYDVKHDCLQSIHTRVPAEPLAIRPVKPFFQVGILAAVLQVPTRPSLFVHESERKSDLKRLMLCSHVVKVREACATRGFCFLNRKFHVFCCPFGPLAERPGL